MQNYGIKLRKNLFSKILDGFKLLLTQSIVLDFDRILFHFHNISFKKIVNGLIAHASIYFKPARAWAWPTHLQMEPSNLCNLRCSYCPITEGIKRPLGTMDFDVFKKIIDETGDYVFFIIFWELGEPFLNPRIYDMISYAKRKGIQLVSSSNGHVFAEQKNVDKLIKSGLDALIIGVDGITQEAYGRFRHGGNLETVLTGIRNIVARKRALNSQTPFINMRSIVMKSNEHDIPKLKRLAESLGVDAFTLKTMNPYGADRDLLPDDYRYRRFTYADDGKTPIKATKNPCKLLWTMSTIHWDGTVCGCEFDANSSCGMGNIRTDSFKNIWNSPDYKKLRLRFKKDWRKIPFCNICSYSYKGGCCATDLIIDTLFFDNKKHVLKKKYA